MWCALLRDRNGHFSIDCSLLFSIANLILYDRVLMFGLGALWTMVLVWWLQHWRLRRVPGPRGWWMVGNALDIATWGSHEAFRKWADRFGPVYKAKFGSWRVVVVADAALARTALKRSSVRPAAQPISEMRADFRSEMATSLLFANGSLWRKLRPVWHRSFRSSSLKQSIPAMKEAAAVLTDELELLWRSGTSEVDIHRISGDLSFDVIASLGLGWETAAQRAKQSSGHAYWQGLRGDAATVFRSAQSSPWVVLYALCRPLLPVVRVLSSWFPDAAMRAILMARSRLMAALQMHLLSPIAHQTGPVCSLLSVDSCRDCPRPESVKPMNDPLSEKSVRLQQALLMLLAGYETTSSAIAFACHLLSRPSGYAAQKGLAVELLGHGIVFTDDVLELPYLDAVVKEALRLLPPAHLTIREAAEDMRIGGYTISRGQWLLIPIYAIHRSKQWWGEDAEVFRPERWLDPPLASSSGRDAFMPFGGGSRACPGAGFAVQEIKIVLFHLFTRFSFRIAAPQAELKLRTSATMAPKNGAWLHFAPIDESEVFRERSQTLENGEA